MKGLQSMINTCEDFGVEYSIKFNSSKTECIKFGSNYSTHGNVYMDNKKLVWSQKVKHLGNILSCDLSDDSDIKVKKGRFYHYVNKLIALFGKMPCTVLNMLFTSYCTSFYGSQIWDLESRTMKELYIAWQK